MKKRKIIGVRGFLLCSLSLAMLFVFTVSNTYATNGYFANGYSVESKALAGAGVAMPQGSLDASINPAAMAFIGKRIDIGISLFNPNREYTINGTPSGQPYFGLIPGTVKSHSRWFVIPSAGYNYQIDDKNSIGVSIYGNGGMNTDYYANTFLLSPRTGVDLMQLFIAPTYTRKLAPKHAVGITPIFAYQRFKAKGLTAFTQGNYSSDSSHLTNKGYDNSYGIGARIGYLGEIFPNLNIGASYQTRIWMSRFDKYAGLFAEQGDFDIPATWTIGLAYKVIPELTVLVDVQEIYYSDIKSIHNPLSPNILTSQLGKDNGAGFGWDDITVLKLGVQWQSSKDWIWRAGYSIGDQPIPKKEVLFNILAPGVIKQHVTFGFTRAIGDKQELKFALMHAFSHSVSGPNPLDPAQKIKIKMNQWEFSLGYAWKF